MRVLVTGAAGFIGSRLSERLLARGDEVLDLADLARDVALGDFDLRRRAGLCGGGRQPAGRSAVHRLGGRHIGFGLVHLGVGGGIHHQPGPGRGDDGRHLGIVDLHAEAPALPVIALRIFCHCT